MKEYWGSGYSGVGGGGGGGGGGVDPTLTIFSAVALSQGQIVTWTNSGLALADASMVGEVLGVCKYASAAGAYATVSILDGQVYEVLFDAIPATSDEGKRVYLSATPGCASLTPPLTNSTTVIRLGLLYQADGSSVVNSVLFRPVSVARIP
jgi:hypothetical protein